MVLQDKNRAQNHRIWELVKATYLQFAAIAGALSLLSLLHTIFAFGGALEILTDWWANNVRPVVDLIYAPIKAVLSGIFGYTIDFPVVVKDYLAVGIVLLLSRWRGATGGWKNGTKKSMRSIINSPLKAFILLVRTLLFWPWEIGILFKNLLFAASLFPDRSAEEISSIRWSNLIALLPVFYAVFLFTLNLILLFFPSLISRRNLAQAS